MGSVPPTLTHTALTFQPAPKMDIASKNEFIYFMQRAVEDQQNDCYIKLYNLLLRAFVSADADFDGQVSLDEFGGMISAAAALPKKFGFDWWQGSPADMFKAIDENGDGSVPFQLAEEREKTFAKMDENGDGSIAFNEWLAFFLQ